MAGARTVAGLATLTIDGVPYNMVELEFSSTSIQWEELINMSGFDDEYQAKPVAGMIKAKLRLDATTGTDIFQTFLNVTVQTSLINGMYVIATGARCFPPESVSAVDGTFEVTFKSSDVKQVLVNA